MGEKPDAIELVEGSSRSGRLRLPIRDEFILAVLPTVTVLLVLWTGDVLASRPVLFSALASSAFLIYVDPMLATNRLPVLTFSHLAGALLGMGAVWILGYGVDAAVLAVGLTIVVMIVANIMHPPAIGTSLSFAFHSGLDAHITLFLFALGMIVMLGVLQRITQYLLLKLTR